MLAVEVVWKHSVKVEYYVIEEVEEVQNVILLHTRESGRPDKCGRIVFLQEEDPSVKIGKGWTALAVDISERDHR